MVSLACPEAARRIERLELLERLEQLKQTAAIVKRSASLYNPAGLLGDSAYLIRSS